MKWDPPSDWGGADITTYILEIDGGSGKYCLKVMFLLLSSRDEIYHIKLGQNNILQCSSP
jgi:hypothetical protein